MPVLLLAIVVGISGWIITSTILGLRNNDLGRRWWITFVLLLAFGVWVGYWFLSVEYRFSPKLRIVGIPLAIGLFQKEGDRWTDFIPNLQLLNAAVDVVFGIAVCILPLRVAAILRRRKESPQP